MPSAGRIRTWRTPPEVDGLRIDAGYREGDAVPPNYDAMLAKVIAWAPTRQAAIRRLARGLDETDVRGVATNIPFLSALITHADVRANAVDTGFIERHLQELTRPPETLSETELAAAVAAVLLEESKASLTDPASPWRTAGWMAVGRRRRRFVFRQGQAEHEVTFVYGNGPDEIQLEGKNLAFAFAADDSDGIILTLDGRRSRVVFALDGRGLYLRTRNGRFELLWVDPFGEDDEEQAGEDRIIAPLPGTVVALFAEEGTLLEKGAPILALEVMKMEQTLRAPFAGRLKKIKCRVGDVVQEGVELAEIEAVA